MKFKPLFALLLPLSLCASEAAHTGGTWSGVRVAEIKVCTPQGCPPKGRVLVKLSAGATGTPPSCSSSYRNWVVIDVSEAGGGLAAATMQQVRLLGGSISVEGTGNCGIDPAIETAASVTLTGNEQ